MADPRLVAYLATIGVDEGALKGWKVKKAYRSDEMVGFVLTKGTEIHILPLVKRAMSRRNIRELLAPLMNRYGYATTRVPIEITDHKLRLALGFAEAWRDHQFSYWVITDLPYSKE